MPRKLKNKVGKSVTGSCSLHCSVRCRLSDGYSIDNPICTGCTGSSSSRKQTGRLSRSGASDSLATLSAVLCGALTVLFSLIYVIPEKNLLFDEGKRGMD